MSKQTIIAISREYGSGGHEIARRIAADLGLKMYDRKLLDEMADEKNIEVEYLEKYDEKPRKLLLSRTVNGYCNSIEEIVAEMQFDYIRERAESGESFVIVGRCAETVLADFEGLISFFVLGDQDAKVARVRDHFELDDAGALSKMQRHDKTRKRYHNRHSDGKWGDSRLYDMCINSSKVGIEKTTQILEDYIKARA
ncbi:MAG: cytidylate kinase-like family protein [Clostridiales bacterium]|nr:cytidylate kinase-like family protein [Clostridiales bacterium]